MPSSVLTTKPKAESNALGFVVTSCFVLFFVGFFSASVWRFCHVVYPARHQAIENLPLLAIAIFSGIALAQGLSLLNLFATQAWKKFVYGGVMGVVLFFALFATEDLLSNKKLYTHPNSQSFSQIKGHCGVYTGRALQKIYRFSWDPGLASLLADFDVSNQCRIHRFMELSKRGQLDCRTGEDPVQCLTRWMPVFAERGYWNGDAREMFYQQVQDRYQTSKIQGDGAKISNDSLIEYALKDYELEMARPSILKQAGLEEEFSDDYMVAKQSDDLENVVLTKKIFEAITAIAQNEISGALERPLISKYKETLKEVNFKTEKIPELEKDLNELKKRAQL